ncbi:hypothetical protein [Lentzea nigeriaca]|uniref:hypothetical protein n=1 Tax=Lentzea nigeriaca TaxID=1128665 RepID=UPI00195DCE7F|nr:hypothetical protein [Lentzea nigeriaca]MBM7864693.1 hypothetical protein [Lentzea nigeriaca]
MTSTLPPARDLPPGRQDEIRVEIEQAVAGRGARRMRLAPVLAAATAVGAVVAGVVFFTPSSQPQTAIQPAPMTTQSASATPTTRPAPVVPGLSEERIAAIEKGCLESTGLSGEPKLYQHVGSGPGAFALIYTANAMLTCTLDSGGMAFNSGFSSGFDPEWLPGHFSTDSIGASSGGDTPYNRPIYRGVHGYRTAAGRVDSKVARVTFTADGQTVDATIANNTFVARIVHPTTWSPPEDNQFGEVRAYDAVGNLLGTNKGSEKCYANPQGVIVPGGWVNPDTDPKTCEPALPWR